MKTISTALNTHLQGEVTTLCTCWTTTLTDGAVYGFTDHVEDITFGGVTYLASSAYSASAVETNQGLEVDNLELLGMIDPSAFNQSDVRAGRWDFATVEIFLLNYKDLTQGALQLRKGILGEVSMGKSMFTAELRGMSQRLAQSVGRLHMPACDADLGDDRCKVDLTALPRGIVHGAVTSINTRRIFVDTSLTDASGWFDYGKVTFTSGANDGYAREVKSFVIGGMVNLQEAFPFDIAVSDTYDIQVGCDKLFSTCTNKFGNWLNFQGFPHLPGMDRLMSGQ
jgi:uncharacterized phage protein (TIGR02218 family)